jgi:hypothetical protein
MFKFDSFSEQNRRYHLTDDAWRLIIIFGKLCELIKEKFGEKEFYHASFKVYKMACELYDSPERWCFWKKTQSTLGENYSYLLLNFINRKVVPSLGDKVLKERTIIYDRLISEKRILSELERIKEIFK